MLMSTTAKCMKLTRALFSGVVDRSLKVYGTKNLRVVDASIFPMQIAAHTQATVYAIAEKVTHFLSQQSRLADVRFSLGSEADPSFV